ncbi:MAG: hypothetical protein FJ202_13840 [Gemmatimonadetes bacterium]|nr:hypothetical protein [Gemmatimonadota bacterium]
MSRLALPSLSGRDARALLLGAAILVPSLGWIYGVSPYRAAIADLRERAHAERSALAREEAALAEAPRAPARKRVADSALKATEARVFSGANDVAAGASLVNYLGDVARSSRVWVASAATRQGTGAAGTRTAGGRGSGAPDPLSGAAAAGLRVLRVELRGESDFQGAMQFLHALESGTKVVRVERFDLSRAVRSGEEGSETLAITATVVGFGLTMPGASGTTR